MRTETTTRDLYKFNELSNEAKEIAISNNYDWNVSDQFWSEYVTDDAKEIGKMIGIDIEAIYFSGFSSQGDGACFVGSYVYRKGAAKAVADYAPTDSELLRIAKGLQAEQRKAFYGVYGHTAQRGHYMHSGCMSIELHSENDQPFDDDEIAQLLRDFADWFYKRLEAEYDYLTSAEAIAEGLSANKVEFTENGENA